VRCSPDAEQWENTALLFEARQQDPAVFQQKLQDIEAIFGEEELATQLQFLQEYTSTREKAAAAAAAAAAEAAPAVPAAGSASMSSAAQASPEEPATETPGWALTIKPKWCGKILNGTKTWEIKGQNCKKHLHERICIAESGSGMLVGEMTICESKKISRQDLEENTHLHGNEDLSIITHA
jgi:hypothetical protein